MPNCVNCGTWNPDDKVVCWRCQAELPKPVVKKKRGQLRLLGVPLWLWLAVVFFFVMMIVLQLLSRMAGV
jgi:predicted nucleic acid-binding Zn ribbon protein